LIRTSSLKWLLKFGLGEGGLVGCSKFAECVCPLLPNPCYKLAAVNYRKTKIEALNKRIKKKRDGNK
jgi:hypothetical protein